MKVNILEWHGVTTWHWKVSGDSAGDGYMDELCGICRVAFDGTCPNCKYPGDECPIVLGSGCTHNFHLHCILKWLEQDTSKGLCPMCRQIFTFKQTEDTVIIEELKSLQSLIDGHRLMRERANTSEQEFETFDDEDLQMAST